MDRPENPMVICAVMITERPLELDALRELIRERLLAFERFRGRLWRRRPGREAGLELDRHVHVLSLAPDASEADLGRCIARLMLRPLPREEPLWEVHWAAHYRGGSALVWRIHHAVADGVALLGVLLGAADVPSRLPRGAVPMHAWPRGRDLGRVAGALGRLVVLPKDARSPIKSKLSGKRKVAWSAPVPLERVKAFGRAHQATVNDVLTAALAGALRRYFLARGVAPPKALRAVVPVDLRVGKTDERLGNRFGLVFLPLPVGVAALERRLKVVRRWMAKLKKSHEAAVAFVLLKVIGLVSPALSAVAIQFFVRKASVVLTNVAGPREKINLRGVPVREIFFWVPQAQSIGLGMSIFSYAGEVRVGINSDAACVESPQELADGFAEELSALTFNE